MQNISLAWVVRGGFQYERQRREASMHQICARLGKNAMHAKLFSQNPLVCCVSNTNLICVVLDGSTPIRANQLLNLGNDLGHRTTEGSPSVLVVVNRCLSSPKPSTPVKQPCTAHAFFPKSLLNHTKSLRFIVPEPCTKFDAHSLLFFYVHTECRHTPHTRYDKRGRQNSPHAPT